MNAREPITGKVARVLNTRELVINRGSEHGVKRGMTFEVLDARGSDITDPDTGEIIGSVYRPKVRVRVVVAEPKVAVARTYRSQSKNVGGSGGLGIPNMASLLAPPRWIEIPETFKSDEAAWEEITEEQSFVKTGDPVREVFRAQKASNPESASEGPAPDAEPDIPDADPSTLEPAE